MNSEVPSPEELLSAAFDANRVSESNREAVGPEHAEVLLHEWQQVGDLLRGLPVREVPCPRFEEPELQSAEQASRLHATAAVDLIHPSNTQPAAQLSRQRLAVLTTCLAIAFLAFGIRASLVDPTNDQFASGGLLSNMSDWQVVVVTIDDDAVEPASQLMRRTVADLGLEVQPLMDRPSARAQHDVLLTNADDSEAVLQSLRAIGTESMATELNPQTVAGMDRKELLKRLEESMRTPTRSDEFFGDMLVAVAAGDSVIVQRRSAVPSPAATNHQESIGIADAAAGDVQSVTVQTQQGAESISDYLSRRQARPVVFVIRRSGATAVEPQGAAPGPHRPDVSAATHDSFRPV